jgi:CBS domain-containing protein
MIMDDAQDPESAVNAYRRVLGTLAECGYIPAAAAPFEPAFYAATLGDWKNRFQRWVGDPIYEDMYRARPLFDLRPVHGQQALWQDVDAVVRTAINGNFLRLVANDCLESLPPLTFFADAVINESGEQSDVFRLEYSALGPIVDVGRVFGMASGKTLGSSTFERLDMARTLLPDHSAVFREASDTLRVVLWQQGRVGISQNTDGSELPPALLGRYDRQLLKSGFRSIHRLLELISNSQWLKTI